MYFPFRVENLDDFDFPISIRENSRYKVELKKINQDFLNKVFPNSSVYIQGNSIYGCSSVLGYYGGRKIYEEVEKGNVYIEIYRKPTSKPNGKKFQRFSNAVLDLILLFFNLSLTEHLNENTSGKIESTGTKGSFRQSTVIIEKSQMSALKKYLPKYLEETENKLSTMMEILRNADINGHNSFGLKCSLLVIIIESFILESSRSDKDNFANFLNEYMDSSDSRNKYREFYIKRGTYFHSGKDDFDAEDWWELKNIVEKIFCNYLDNPEAFKNKIKLIKEK